MPFKERIEIGPWFETGQVLDHKATTNHFTMFYEKSSNHARPYCVYVHIPFCSSICNFCALYTQSAHKKSDAIFDEYLSMIKRHIAIHPACHQSQPPTTVHFGGGTPLHIGIDRFVELTKLIRAQFGDSSACEWAVEATTSSIGESTKKVLKDLGFQRIHIGIQTLDNDIRKKIGRHESGNEALEKVHLLRLDNFSLSVDLILGFEDTTEIILQNDLYQLYEAGIRMFSICELRQRNKISEPNRNGKQPQKNKQLWNIIWQFMKDHNLSPIHIGQFAHSQKDNLYFTHPARREDCVALGPYAHGSAHNLYYGNTLLPQYYHLLQKNILPIEMGVVYSDSFEVIRNLERELLTHRISKETLNQVSLVYPELFPGIINIWQETDLIRKTNHETFILSKEGSWFIGNMVMQARRMTKQTNTI